MLPDRRQVLGSSLALPLAAALPTGAGAAETAAPATLARDPLRPRYHFQPPAHWMNDPNGPIYWQGRYHLFYQYNPQAAVWGSPDWGHAVSTDMIHWRNLPVALTPTPGRPDADGVFSGTALVADGQVHMMYTGVRAVPLAEATIKDGHPPLLETQCLATATDAMLTRWRKRPTPVIAAPPGMLVNGFRDPSPWRQGDSWYAVLGSGIANRGGAILLYRSTDLISWQFVRIFARQDAADGAFDPWQVWECPEFFALGDRHVLIFSCAGKAYWQSGRLDPGDMTFRAERTGILDYGSYYAPKTQLDAQGNRILWGWVPETRSDADNRAAGWAGMMALPRVLTLDDHGGLVQSFLPGLDRLRGKEISVGPDLPPRIVAPGCCAEIEIRISERRRDFAIDVVDASEGTVWLPIAFSADHPKLIWIDGRPLEAFADTGGGAVLRLFIDGSVIAASVDARVHWTRRFYYPGKRRDAVLRISSPADNGLRVSIWPMMAIAPEHRPF
ncbi:MAG: glycoside hydrolase family 32 protein [Sphingomonas sp.]